MSSLAQLLEAHPLPDLSGGKDDSGTVVVIGGPPSCPGAVLLAATAALRVGSGRVQIVVDPSVAQAAAAALPEVLVTGWDQSGAVPQAVRQQLDTADAVLMGPGHQHLPGESVAAVAEHIRDSPIVLDAGALPAANQLDLPRLVLAPNTAEAQALLGDPDVVGAEATLAAALSDRLAGPVAVRGKVTVVADAGQAWVFDASPPGLGTPGSGDVLMGALAGLLAAGLPPVAALAWAVQLHADAGALLARSTPVGYLASDIARRLPDALAAVTRG